MADELGALYQSLEVRVAERTRQIQTASEVARAVTIIPDLNELLRQAVNLIRDQFEFSHVSIFLLNREGSHVVLRESTGEVGEKLKAAGHRLEVGSESMIGWVTEHLETRVATDVSLDPIHRKHELLPDTRAEAVIPLQIAGKLLGVLDVHSVEADAFQEEDLEVLQTLADQLSAAIENARLAQASAMAAERARLVSEITGQLSGLMEPEEVLHTAARELHRGLGDAQIVVKLTPPSESYETGE
jgi:GAF domain-containing protein